MNLSQRALSAEIPALNKFIKTIGHRGLLSAECKRDSRDGALKLLEINADLGGTVGFQQRVVPISCSLRT